MLANKGRIPIEIIFLSRCSESNFGRVFCFRKKTYIVYGDLRLNSEALSTMKNYGNKEEIRWQVVKAMLDEFPTLRKKVKSYIKTTEN